MQRPIRTTLLAGGLLPCVHMTSSPGTGVFIVVLRNNMPKDKLRNNTLTDFEHGGFVMEGPAQSG